MYPFVEIPKSVLLSNIKCYQNYSCRNDEHLNYEIVNKYQLLKSSNS